jgi:hypothetical protein
MPKVTMIIRAKAGSELEVLNEVKAVEGVEDVSLGLDGEVCAVVNADTIEKLKQITTWKIRTIANIISTTTKVAEEPSNSKAKSPLMEAIEMLKELSDQKFERVIQLLLEKSFLDSDQYDLENIVESTESSKQIVQSASLLLRWLVWKNLSGDLTVNSFKEILSNNTCQFSQSKINILFKLYEAQRNELRFTLLFNMVKELSSRIDNTSKELKDLYGHVLDVCSSTKEEVKKLAVEK